MKFRVAAIAVLAFLMLCGPVMAIGLSPARQEVDFQPGFEHNYSFYVINTEDRELDVEFYVSGDLAEYITLSQ